MSRCLMKVLSSGNLGVAARIGLCQDFPVAEKPPLLLLLGWLGGGDQGSPTLESFANRFDFEIFKSS